MEDYFHNSKYKIQDTDFDEDGYNEQENLLFPQMEESEANTTDQKTVKYFTTIPKQVTKERSKLFNRRLFLEDLGQGSFSQSYILSSVNTTPIDMSEEYTQIETFEDVSPAPKNQKIGLKVYNTINLASQRKLDYETMQWTNNLTKLISEVDLWSIFSGKHPNLCQLYSVYEQIGEEKVYLEMELGDLGHFCTFDEYDRVYSINSKLIELSNTYYPDPGYNKDKQLIMLIRKVFQDLLDGLEYLHSQNIAHRDLKIENFILCNNTCIEIGIPITAKWIDFNSAKLMDNENHLCYDTEGTLNYCAPEEIFGVDEGYDVFKADIWSLGCVFYAILFGKLAFDIPGADRFNVEIELTMKIQKEEPALSGLENKGSEWDQAVDLISKMLVKNVDTRVDLNGVKSHNFFNN